MTKQELENNLIWKNMPHDTEIVYNTNLKAEDCKPLSLEDITFRTEIVGWVEKEAKLNGFDKKEPIYKSFLVLNNSVLY